ncbi:MAG: FAD-binding oxidoreductase [Candidatus Symbiothrix sp.]|jgi:D-lactate dehydrogenase|nr:FAD-binding oxidoreductase [Candidatus Symbiothrix sp.]
MKYKVFLKEIAEFIPRERIYTDELRRLAWGTDAGFYRLIPQIVVRSMNEQEVSRLLAVADRLQTPVTFRAAGTSLSGQAISDSVLIVAGKYWEDYAIAPDAGTIRMQPGITGERVGELLKPYGRKFAPDPASVKSAMVGGIVINNASGMNCGIHANSDRMLLSARMVFADGLILDTGDAESRSQFARNKPEFIREIEKIRDRVRTDKPLAERIRHKYSIKNVTGLNILPFILYDDPFDIITHLLVGSEGTLAFLSEITMKTEYDYPFKASAMLYFSDIREACRAVVAMKKLTNKQGEPVVKGAELLDKKSLKSVEDFTGEGLTAVLVETKATTKQELDEYIAQIEETLQAFPTPIPVYFTDKESEYSRYWLIRSGIFPSVGGTRPPGTTTLIEDVAFHIENLPEATAALQELMEKHGYDDACIYGHALEGNYHFIINQSFDTQTEVERYEALMDDVIKLVVDKYDGSLKAEHGTGRNMAPFVRYEWGDAAFEVMRAVKQLFDPKGLLNPGVIFNDDPKCHIRNFKPLPLTNPKVDKCIECGFCEMNCLTCGFTLSSRQRIVLQREIARLKSSGQDPQRLRTLQKQYRYPGNQTCAGDGLCSTSCPMGINTGDLTHDIRRAEIPESSMGYAIGKWTAGHLSTVKSFLRPALSTADAAHTILGTQAMTFLAGTLHHRLHLPLWTPAMPKSYQIKSQVQISIPNRQKPDTVPQLKVVYFPSCINQTMGLAKNSPEKWPLVNKMVSLLQKSGYEVIFPERMDNLCCGTIWESKGMPDIADRKAAELSAALYKAGEQGKYPVLCDQSPCLYRMRHTIREMKLYEPVEFIMTFLLDKLEFVQTDTPVAVHVTCSMRKMDLAGQIVELAKRCSSNVLTPEEVGCCGFAGDKGFTHPEVNAYALRKLHPQIEKAGIRTGYSNSRTCEIGLTTNSGIPYQSIIYLVDRHTKSIHPLKNT